ncbi:hypothetical protein [Enterococcus termitis]|uniref:Uncharacterized protein n=2 Tax=Enterococcus termitis TaxID=332950 RepID=A0A1E5H5Z7_9ENTE|nr:hypothetical protein [Enterococcus termitis]OEG20398.1 hypothetical protein BCR25_00835 [Enterococcus termitis]
MKKVLITVLSCGFLIGSVATPVVSIVFADEAVAQEIHPDSDAPISSDEGASYLDIPEINLDEDIKEYEVEVPSPKARAAFVIIWKIESKTASGTSYGPWRNGPSGKGKATLSANNSNTSSRSVSSSISGDYPIGKGKIGASLGITIGQSKTYGVSYSRAIPAGKREQIIFRPVYKLTKVKQRKYLAGTKTNTTQTATVKSFSHWDYSFKSI